MTTAEVLLCRIAKALEDIADTGIVVLLKSPDVIDKDESKKEITLNTSIADINFSIRAKNCLIRGGCATLQDVFNAYTDGSIENIRNLGRKCIDEIGNKLVELGYLDTRGDFK